MKKTLLATAIIGALGVSAAAHAATVYDQDGTKLDIYGSLRFGITSGGSDEPGEKSSGSEFEDIGSRWGFRASHDVTSDMSVYARMEFRGKADAENANSADVDNDAGADNEVDFGGFDNVRNTYVGVNSKTYGDVMVGNFDSVYYRSGGVMFDVPQNSGWAHLGGISAGSRGDAISYSTPNLSGFRAHVQAKHLSGNTDNTAEFNNNSSTWTTAAAVDYSIDNFYMSLAYNQGKDVGDRSASYDGGGGFNAGEDLVGVFASYDFTPVFSARIKYEEITDTFDQTTVVANADGDSTGADESIAGIGATFDYGQGDIYGDYYHIESAIEGVDSRNQWVVGASYKFSKPMFVYAEMVDQDADYDEETELGSLNDDLLYTVGVRYDF